MLLPLRLNLLAAGQLAAAPEDQRVFLKRANAKRKPFVVWGAAPDETVWHHPPLPPQPIVKPPLKPEVVASFDELLARSKARAQSFTDDEQAIALLLLAA